MVQVPTLGLLDALALAPARPKMWPRGPGEPALGREVGGRVGCLPPQLAEEFSFGSVHCGVGFERMSGSGTLHCWRFIQVYMYVLQLGVEQVFSRSGKERVVESCWHGSKRICRRDFLGAESA